jgi:hypothetical protein
MSVRDAPEIDGIHLASADRETGNVVNEEVDDEALLEADTTGLKDFTRAIACTAEYQQP